MRIVAHADSKASLGHVPVVAEDLGLLPWQRVVQSRKRSLRIADKSWGQLHPRGRCERNAFDRGVPIDVKVVCSHVLNLARPAPAVVALLGMSPEG